MKKFLKKKADSEFFFANFFRFLLVLGIVWGLLGRDWINIAFSVIALFLTFLPGIIQRRLQVFYPQGMQISLIFFIFASLYLGEVQYFYDKFWWWDILLHAFSGVIIGYIGFSLIYILNRDKGINLSISLEAVFAFCFSMTIGAIWEVFEFLMDKFFGTNMQKSGLLDTMTDLMLDMVGAFLISLSAYIYLRRIKGGGREKLKKLGLKFVRRMKKRN